jgi:hypothetical protein
MKKLLPFLFVLPISIVHGQDSARVKKDSIPWALYHAIEARLDTVFDEDQSGRQKLSDPAIQHNRKRTDSLWKVIRKKDSINLEKVKAVLDQYGWLGIDEIGEKANMTLFLVVQHADSLTQVTYLPMMREAVQQGKARPENLALLEDRVLTRQGKPQIYGSQVRTGKSGKYEFFPIGDERNVNNRRSAVGLEPLEIYARNFGIDYHLPK